MNPIDDRRGEQLVVSRTKGTSAAPSLPLRHCSLNLLKRISCKTLNPNQRTTRRTTLLLLADEPNQRRGHALTAPSSCHRPANAVPLLPEFASHLRNNPQPKKEVSPLEITSQNGKKRRRRTTQASLRATKKDENTA
ncbi:hypothetical protein V8G54_035985 [Vigna mungo]|uniref:Uncharacterized protein n=1 Tax=Vigna mungo TaxID=3915 RepID=A0AAQ3MGG1_VIGMU